MLGAALINNCIAESQSSVTGALGDMGHKLLECSWAIYRLILSGFLMSEVNMNEGNSF